MSHACRQSIHDFLLKYFLSPILMLLKKRCMHFTQLKWRDSLFVFILSWKPTLDHWLGVLWIELSTIQSNVACSSSEHIDITHCNNGIPEVSSKCGEKGVCIYKSGGWRVGLQFLVWSKKSLVGPQVQVVELVEFGGCRDIQMHCLSASWGTLCLQQGCKYGIQCWVYCWGETVCKCTAVRDSNGVSTCAKGSYFHFFPNWTCMQKSIRYNLLKQSI